MRERKNGHIHNNLEGIKKEKYSQRIDRGGRMKVSQRSKQLRASQKTAPEGQTLYNRYFREKHGTEGADQGGRFEVSGVRVS